MTFIVSDNCIGTTDKSCYEVCPVDCIYEVGVDPDRPSEPYMLIIDPEECIDCGACEQECPVEAIQKEDMVPERWAAFIGINYMHEGRGAENGPAEDDRESKADIAEAARKAHVQLQEGVTSGD